MIYCRFPDVLLSLSVLHLAVDESNQTLRIAVCPRFNFHMQKLSTTGNAPRFVPFFGFLRGIWWMGRVMPLYYGVGAGPMPNALLVILMAHGH